MSKQEFNGKTLDEALATAARALGTDVHLLSYNILPQSSGGLFSKLFQRGVRLEAWIDEKNDVQAAAREAVRQARADADKPRPRDHTSDERGRTPRQERPESGRPNRNKPRQDDRSQRGHKASGPQPRTRDQTLESRPMPRSERVLEERPLSGVEQQDERPLRPRIPLNSEESKALLVELAEKFANGFDPNIEPKARLDYISEDEVIVTVDAPNLEELLTRSDRLSCAYEHLFKRIAQKRIADVAGRIALNAGTASEQRENKLRDMALDVANRVKENGKTITLSSKSSQERRVIHLALEHMDGIATKSVGVGENRKLIVYSTLRPARNNSDGKPRNNHRTRQHSERTRGSNNLPREFSASADPQGAAEAQRRPRRRGRKGPQRFDQSRQSNTSVTSETQSQQRDEEGPSINSET